MNKIYFFTPIGLLLFIMALMSSCNGQKQPQLPENELPESKIIPSESSTVKENNDLRKSYGVSDVVSTGLLDKEGILWLGTNHEGIYRYDGTSFTHFSTRDGLCDNTITAILEDRDGILWFGTADGLCRYDKKAFTHVPIPWVDTSSTWLDKVYPTVNPNAVRCLLQDKNGFLWIGTNGAGAYRYDGKTFTSFLSNEGRKQEDSLYHNIISSVVEDLAGNIWFTSMTHGGISLYDGKSFTHFTLKNGLSDDMITSSLLDSKGNIWFGSLGNRAGGLHLYDGNAFTNFTETDGLSNKNIRSIHEDQTGKLWIGSDRGILSIYDANQSPRQGKKFIPFTSKEGQSFSRISFITEDASGNIWFGGNYGNLFRYDGKTVTDFTQKGS